jgi:large subunit ribosomal protein L10
LPSEKILEAKKAEVAAIAERLQNACAGVIVDYKGINVADDTALRKELREAGVEYTVTKNTMIKLAIDGTDLEGLGECLEGTTALATSTDDYVAAARILCKYASKHENFNVKSGFLDNEVISVEKIDSLAKLPTRDVLLATVANVFNAPIAAFARVVQAIVDKDGETAEAAAE